MFRQIDIYISTAIVSNSISRPIQKIINQPLQQQHMGGDW